MYDSHLCDGPLFKTISIPHLPFLRFFSTYMNMHTCVHSLPGVCLFYYVFFFVFILELFSNSLR